jgi:hypothetical protein
MRDGSRSEVIRPAIREGITRERSMLEVARAELKLPAFPWRSRLRLRSRVPSGWPTEHTEHADQNFRGRSLAMFPQANDALISTLVACSHSVALAVGFRGPVELSHSVRSASGEGRSGFIPRACGRAVAGASRSHLSRPPARRLWRRRYVFLDDLGVGGLLLIGLDDSSDAQKFVARLERDESDALRAAAGLANAIHRTTNALPLGSE